MKWCVAVVAFLTLTMAKYFYASIETEHAGDPAEICHRQPDACDGCTVL